MHSIHFKRFSHIYLCEWCIWFWNETKTKKPHRDIEREKKNNKKYFLPNQKINEGKNEFGDVTFQKEFYEITLQDKSEYIKQNNTHNQNEYTLAIWYGTNRHEWEILIEKDD